MATTRASRRGIVAMHPKLMIAFVVTVAVTIAVWLLWAGPARAHANDLAHQVDSTMTQISSAQDRVAALKSGQQSSATGLLTQAQALDTQLPQAVDKVSLVASVTTAAAAAGLSVGQMDPITQDGATTSLSFSMAITGPGSQLTAFLANMTSPTSPYGLMTINDMVFTSDQDKSTATFTLKAFFSDAPPLGATD